MKIAGGNILTVTVVAILAGSLIACAGAPSEAEPQGVDTTSEPTADTGGDPPDEVVVTLIDYSFVGLPETVGPGTPFTVVNESEAEVHEMVAFRLPDDEERPVEELTGLSPDELEAALGRPTLVLLAAPAGPPILAVGDGALVEPGRYAIFCFIPTGVDPEEYLAAAAAAAETGEGPPQIEGGPPHFVNGMFAEIEVADTP
jgi:hypothetical protein